jgi:hypothetical protein
VPACPVRDMGTTRFDVLTEAAEGARDPRSKQFIPRHGSRRKDLEIHFDPDRHKCAE